LIQSALIEENIQCNRDTRIDVFRALALLTVFINHIPDTVYEHFTHRNFGFSDSAEACVLISGIAFGLSHRCNTDSYLRIGCRAFTLYTAHILMTLVTLAIFCGAALFMHHPEFFSMINIEPVIREPAKAFFGIVTLGHQLGYNNILSLYVILMLTTPLMLFLIRVNTSLLLILSGTLYLLAGLFHIAPPNYPTKGVWFLNPLSWQFLFAIGLSATIHIKRHGKIPYHPVLLVGAAGYLVLSCIWVRWNLWWIDISLGLPRTLTGFNKTYISLPRLVHILSLAYVITVIPTFSSIAQTSRRNPLAVLGRHSLPVFITGTMFIIQLVLAYYLEWLDTINRQEKNNEKKKYLMHSD